VPRLVLGHASKLGTTCEASLLFGCLADTVAGGGIRLVDLSGFP
jgi:hypothetical protein